MVFPSRNQPERRPQAVGHYNTVNVRQMALPSRSELQGQPQVIGHHEAERTRLINVATQKPRKLFLLTTELETQKELAAR
jgi:hypothetical protein